jgi:AcrR family transcriptional regulator
MNSRSRSRESVHPRLRTRLRELTADTILEAAEQVFAETGPTAGMDAIATRAGVAVGTLYNHFRDRDTLVDALFEARVGALLERVRRAIDESAGLGFRTRLVLALEAVLTSTSTNSRFRQVFLQAEQRKPRKSDMLEQIRMALLPLFEQGRREGALLPDPHELQAAFLLGLLHTALVAANDTASVLPRERVVPIVVAQFLAGAGNARP